MPPNRARSCGLHGPTVSSHLRKPLQILKLGTNHIVAQRRIWGNSEIRFWPPPGLAAVLGGRRNACFTCFRQVRFFGVNSLAQSLLGQRVSTLPWVVKPLPIHCRYGSATLPKGSWSVLASKQQRAPTTSLAGGCAPPFGHITSGAPGC